MKSPGDDAAVFGNGASGAAIRSQNSAVDSSTPALKVSRPEGHEERHDPDPLRGGLGRVQVGRGIGEDRDAAQGGFLLMSRAGRCGHDTGRVQPGGGAATLPRMERSLRFVLLGTFTLRFSTGLTGAMLGLYLAKLPTYGGPAVDARLVGLFAAIFYLSELVLSPIFGILSDRIGHHRVMLYGPIFGAVAVVITGLTAYWLNTGFQVDAQLPILGFTRLLEGASTAASVPSILGFIALATAGNELLRGKAAARFEGATLAGLGFGFIVAPTLFAAMGANAFYLNAVVYGDLVPHLLARGEGPCRRGRGRRLAARRDPAGTSR